jgi:hypothetical protein
MSNNKKNKSTKDQMEQKEQKEQKNVKKGGKKKDMDENEINDVLMAIGKKTRNPGVKTLTKSFVNKIKSKTDLDDDSVKSNKSTKSTKSNKSTKGKAKGTKGYDRPKSTFTDNLTKEDVEKKLEDYQKVDDITQIPIGTNLRYFTKKDDELVFRMGGNLKSNNGLPKFVILKNAVGVEWSVQVEGTIFYKKMTVQEIKDEYEEIIKELNGKIKKLKERVKELER